MISFLKRHSGFFLLLAGIAGLVVLNLSQTASAETAEIVTGTTAGTSAGTTTSATSSFVIVDVRGEVYAPGVYRVPAGSRVIDVIGMAGGPTRLADLDALNQAKIVADEMVVYVPALETESGDSGTDWIFVDVKGAVASPGVYGLAAGSRGADAVKAAGGLLGTADVSGVNLSALLSDASILYVPFEEAEGGSSTTAHVFGYGYVAVKGQVLHPGLYYVSTESTVADVIALAGGLTLSGSVQNLDLDAVVIPGSTITVLTETEIFALMQAAAEAATETGTTTATTTGTVTKHLVNINTATSEELDTLYGIGPVLAQNIIDYRAENGYFEKIEDIVNVSGIGQSVYEAIKDDITV